MRLWFPTLLLLLLAPLPIQARPRLVGWGIDKKNIEADMARAAEVGFQVIYTGGSPAQLAKVVEIGRKYGIEIYAVASPSASGWKKHFPNQPVPMQVLSLDQGAAFNFLSAGKNRFLTPYQWGGEPVMQNEVLIYPIVCPGNLELRKLQKLGLAEKLSTPGLAGIVFDGYGYQNYLRCYCDECEKRFAEFRKTHSDLSVEDAEVGYFRGVLVDWINDLADYVRSVKPDAKTAIHIWPVFLPEPLYGNRLDVDFCGQTTAWYTCWPLEKIAQYSRTITETAKAYYPRQEGVGMIGYYDKPDQFPVKDAALVDQELKTMLENGCREVQVCGVKDVLNNEPIAAVFRKYFGKKP